jgi:hypothetical protein
VPIISASVSWLIFAVIGSGRPSLPSQHAKHQLEQISYEAAILKVAICNVIKIKVTPSGCNRAAPRIRASSP